MVPHFQEKRPLKIELRADIQWEHESARTLFIFLGKMSCLTLQLAHESLNHRNLVAAFFKAANKLASDDDSLNIAAG